MQTAEGPFAGAADRPHSRKGVPLLIISVSRGHSPAVWRRSGRLPAIRVHPPGYQSRRQAYIDPVRGCQLHGVQDRERLRRQVPLPDAVQSIGRVP